MSADGESVLPWPSVTPELFTTTDEVYWRDGKPCCARHRRVVVRSHAVRAETDGGTHVCPDCMQEHFDKVRIRSAR